MKDNKEQKALHELANLFDIKYFEKKQEEQQKLKIFESLLKTEIENVKQSIEEIKEESPAPIVEETKNVVTVQIENPEDKVSKIAEYISSQVKVNEAMYPTPIPQGNKDLADALRKINHLEQWVSRIAAAGPGSGEVNFRYLDDVKRSTMTSSNDNWVLEYDSATGHVQFTNQIGPIDYVRFDTNHTHEEERVEGTLCWDPSDRSLNLAHANGVVQQVGQEQYYNVRNLTGNTITNSTIIRFSGAQMNGNARILVEPFLADGTYPNLYVLGLATQDIANNTDGFVTSFGKVRDLNTTGNTVSEVWSQGDILYANPSVAGAFTNVKPTAPNNVNPVAAVLRVDTTEGEIFVRPTFEQEQLYGRFIKATDQIAGNVNFGWAVSFTDTQISNGVSLGTPNTQIVVAESGLYQFDASVQITSTNSSTKNIRFWYRKNGTDVPASARLVSINLNNGFTTLQMTQTFSLAANDYMEIVFATTDLAAYPHGAANTAYAPAAPAILLSVNQVQL
jgi:hypothetical protein